MDVPNSHKLKMVLKDPKLGWALNYDWEIFECDCKATLMVFVNDGAGGSMLLSILKVPPLKPVKRKKQHLKR